MTRAERIAHLRDLVETATRGPWERRTEYGERAEVIRPSSEPYDHGDIIAMMWNPGDASFIAAARDAIPWLLDEIELLNRQLDALRKVNTDLCSQLGQLAGHEP